MRSQNRLLFSAIVFALGGLLSFSTAQAAQLLVTSFPEKLIVSAGDNRTLAFTVFQDGVKMPGVQLQISLVEGSGTLDASSCHTDDSGQCLVSYDAPQILEKGRVEAIATIAGEKAGAVSVDIDVVEVPTLSESGWQCDSDRAVFTTIDNTTPCSDACGTKKDCSTSTCPAGSGEYCHSAQEACGCISDITAEEKDAVAGTADIVTDNSNIAATALLSGFMIILFLASSLIYMTADKKETKNTRKLALIAMINLGIAIVMLSLAISKL